MAIIGTGVIGTTIGRRWLEKGHTVNYGVRDEGAARTRSVSEGADVKSIPEAMRDAAATLIAVPGGAEVGGPVVVGDAYNGTRRLLADSQGRGRLTVRPPTWPTPRPPWPCAPKRSAASARRLSRTAFASGGLLWLESPTNPLLAVADLPP